MTNRDQELANALTQYPMGFMEPIFIADPPLSTPRPRCASGTATLLQLGARHLAITCHHVIQAYRARAGQPRHFQVGHLTLDPEAQLLGEDQRLDIAVIELRSDQILERSAKGNGLPASRFFVPSTWPPDPFEDEDIISFAGFPGEWREQSGIRTFDSYMFSHGAALVHSVSGSRFATRLELDRVERILWLKDLTNIGGMSGGPVFRWRKTKLEAQLVGIIFEYQDSLDVMYARSTSVILSGGSIDHAAL